MKKHERTSFSNLIFDIKPYVWASSEDRTYYVVVMVNYTSYLVVILNPTPKLPT